jgi:hypothetical protein
MKPFSFSFFDLCVSFVLRFALLHLVILPNHLRTVRDLAETGEDIARDKKIRKAYNTVNLSSTGVSAGDETDRVWTVSDRWRLLLLLLHLRLSLSLFVSLPQLLFSVILSWTTKKIQK